MLRFGKTKVANEKSYGTKKNTWNVNVDSVLVTKSVETKTDSMYLIWYLQKVKTPPVLIFLKMSGCVKTFKVKHGDKDKKINWCLSIHMMTNY